MDKRYVRRIVPIALRLAVGHASLPARPQTTFATVRRDSHMIATMRAVWLVVASLTVMD